MRQMISGRRSLLLSANNVGRAAAAAAATGDPYFANVTLLMHMDGVNDGTTFTDVKGHAITRTNAVTKTDYKKFGTASAYCVNGALTTPDSVDFEFGSGNFTVEAFVNPIFLPAPGGVCSVVTKYTTSTSNRSWALTYENVSGTYYLVAKFSTNGSGQTFTVTAPVGLVVGTWYHVAVTRDGDVFRLFMDGVLLDSSTQAVTLYNGTSVLAVGAYGQLSFWANAYIDEVRITKGVARYTGNFTPPTEAFPDS